MTIRTCKYDNGRFGSLASHATYSRNTVAKDDLGVEQPADTPLYARRMARADFRSGTNVKTLGSGANHSLIAGYDLDGKTGLGVSTEPNNAKLWSFTGDSYTDQLTAREHKDGNGDIDLLEGSGPDHTRFELNYSSNAGVVCYGTIFVLAERYFDTNQDPNNRSWEVRGHALLYSQDHGETWTIVNNGNGNATFPDNEAGENRLNHFSLQSWYPIEGTPANDPPLEVWLVWGDYEFSGSGGQVGLTRLTRSAADEHWTVGEARLVYELTGDADVKHVHSCYMVDRRSSGYLLVFSAWGDTPNGNQVLAHKIELTNNDPSQYTTGSVTTNTVDGSPAHQTTQGTGRIGNQWVGCCPGPGEGEAIVGGDEGVDVIMRALDDGGDYQSSDDYLEFERVWGVKPFWFGSSSKNCFRARCHKPHLRSGGWIAGTQPNERSLVYSLDGYDWQQITHDRGGGAGNTESWYADRIVYQDATNIYELPAPSVVSQRPMMLRPSFQQYLTGGPSTDWTQQNAPSGSNTVSFLDTNSNGNYEYPAGHPKAGQELPVQPPTYGPVLHVVADGSNTDCGGWRVSAQQDNSGDASGTLGFVYAVLPLKDSANLLVSKPSATVYKGVYDKRQWSLGWNEGSDANFGDFFATALEVTSDEDGPAPQEFLFCIVGATTKQAIGLYAAPTNTTDGGQAMPATAEKISGVSVGDQWALRCSLQLTESMGNALFSPTLLTIEEDSNNYITVSAISGGQLQLDVVVGGSSNTVDTTTGVWADTADPLTLVVSRLGNGSTEVRISNGGDSIETLTVAAEITGSTIDFRPMNQAGDDAPPLNLLDFVLSDDSALSSAQRDRLATNRTYHEFAESPRQLETA